jgi:hypothetical protein
MSGVVDNTKPKVSEPIDNKAVIDNKVDEQPIEIFAKDALPQVWNSFTASYKNEPRLYGTLTAKVPYFDGISTVIFQVDNAIQKETIQKMQPIILKHLRAVFDDAKIELDILITEATQTIKAYTAEDKFAQMTAKNPALLLLKQHLSLELA